MSAYRELAPPPELATLVRCLWIRTASEAETVDVLPDGCVDLYVRGERAIVAGPDTRPAPTSVQAGDAIVGVRFRRGAAGTALGLPADELRDLRVPLDAIWDGVAQEVAERGAAGPYQLASALALRLHGEPDVASMAAARHLTRVPDTPLRDLAAALGLSDRQLRRRFAAAVGYGPKTFARVMRFRRMLALVRAGEPLAAAAAEAGYSDQPHMTREAVALAGRPPGALR
jgi:AraC-like DNA-binding protein